MNLRSEGSVKFFSRLEKWEKTQAPKTGRIVRVFLDTHMALGHTGLDELAKKEGVSLSALDRGDFVVFINTQQTAMKVFTGGNIYAHLKMPGSHKIDLRVIRLIPSFFTGAQLNYKGALADLIKKQLK